jgi:hypothetical protein
VFSDAVQLTDPFALHPVRDACLIQKTLLVRPDARNAFALVGNDSEHDF